MRKAFYRLVNRNKVHDLFTEYLVEMWGSRMRFARRGWPI